MSNDIGSLEIKKKDIDSVKKNGKIILKDLQVP